MCSILLSGTSFLLLQIAASHTKIDGIDPKNMNSKELSHAIRSASPVTRERLRSALSDYQSILTSRIASIQELASKEETLRSQCGFPSRVGNVPTKGRSSKATLTRNSRVHAARDSQEVAYPSSQRSTSTPPPPPPRVGTQRISSYFLKPNSLKGKSKVQHSNSALERTAQEGTLTAESSPSPSTTHSLEVEESYRVVGPPSATPQSVRNTSPTPRSTAPPCRTSTSAQAPSLQPTAGVVVDDRPTSFSSAEQELRQLFRNQRAAQHRPSTDEPQLASSLNRSQRGELAQLNLPAPKFSTQEESAGHKWRLLSDRNLKLRTKVAAIMTKATHSPPELSLDDDDERLRAPQTEERFTIPLCVCGLCMQWASDAVEHTLPIAFEKLNNALGCSPVGEQKNADDDATQILQREHGNLLREKVLLRLRRVELLAARLHYQRLSWYSRSTNELLGGAQMEHQDKGESVVRVETATKAPSSMDILQALEDAHDARVACLSLAQEERAVAEVRTRLSNSLNVLSALSMLSELQWCAEESVW